MKEITGGITAAKGYKATSCEANIKYKNRTDMAMVFCETPAECAGVFTSNVVKAACVQWDMKLAKSGEPMHAVVINSGIANACTGKEGYEICEKTADAVAEALNIKPEQVCIGSTGVIGMLIKLSEAFHC